MDGATDEEIARLLVGLRVFVCVRGGEREGMGGGTKRIKSKWNTTTTYVC